MFERFTKEVREIVVEARRGAIEQNAREINSVHLLAALLCFPGSVAGRLLAGFGVSLDDVAAEADRVRRRGGISETDAAALGELGIDVDRIIDRIEQVHGPNAMAGVPAVPGHLQRIRMADDSKRALEAGLREVIALGGRHIGSEHILLALTARPGPAADILTRFDVDCPRIREVLSARKTA